MKVNADLKGGTKIAQRIKEIRDKFTTNNRVYIGLPAGSGASDDGTPLVEIGAMHEFGSTDGSIPERSFLRETLHANEDRFNKVFRNLSGDVVRGKITTRQMLDQIGEIAVGYCKEAISEGIPPPNAPSTVKAKGSATPLIDTGTLRNAITYAVED